MNAYRISHYTILAKLGAGGMGEVYKAHDTILDRPVALKILPLELVENADRLRRFIQEAKSASALNHPHIITIYEVGEAKAEFVEAKPDAKDTNAPTGELVSVARETPIHYIAMEYIEGETLTAKIHRDQTGLRKSLEYLAQTADGLTKAHAAGIVHRDLKPDNIMINGDGYAKILDFGLAKLVEPPPAKTEQDSQEEVATAILNRSQPGAVMGTIGYMSPEQALGRAVDQRSDIFAFGCILYEIVTGRKPFAGDSMVDSLHKIIYTPAAPVKDFNQNCPYEIQRIIRRCLSKDPEDRYQRIKDIAIDLRDFLEESKAVSNSGVFGVSSGTPSLSQPSSEMLLDAPVVEIQLDESTPAVLQLSRFSKASVALAVLGLIAAIGLWPLHQRGNIGSELKLDYSKEAAMSKAREVVNGLGYNANNLEVAGRFISTGFDVKYLANKEGVDAVRQAVREGKAGAWQFMFARTSDDASGGVFSSSPGPGQMLVTISPQGQLMSFSTGPEESGDIAAVDQNQAVTVATEQARRWLSFEPAGYNIEVVPRSSPPGLTEVTWRNSTPVLGHKETVRANIQGTKVTRLSRQLNAPQSGKETSAFADTVSQARTVVLVLAVVGMYVFGVAFLIYGKRWQAFGRKISIAAVLLIGLGCFSMIYFQSNNNGSSLGLFLVSLVGTLLISVAFFPSGAGFFEWLRVYNPARLFALEQIIERRFFSPSVSSALVHGVLGGTLLAGLFEAGAFITNRIPGAAPSFSGEIEMINSGWPIITGIGFSFMIGLIFAIGIILLVEFSERVFGHGVLAAIVPALLIAIAITSYNEPRWILIGLSFLSSLVTCLLAIHLYRRYGFATVWLALSVSFILATAVRSHYLKDPGFVWQSNPLLVVVVILLIAGIWGYSQRRLRTTLSALAVNRG
ncbi:MAG TPA: serine/threonine-protein kinase [Pyrinomonadaceae bacterium]|nr:serine/threonine-protein kinase [Pyrinomonadaceae bacterium]